MSNEEIKELIKNKKVREFRQEIDILEFIDIAQIIDELDDEYQVLAFRMLPKDMAADVMAYLPADTQEQIITNITDKEINNIIEDLYVDDAVDMLDELPSNVVRRILNNATPDTRKVLNQFLNYADDSAGSIMTAEYIDLKKDLTVTQAIERIRKTGKEKETINTCYVIDPQRKLEGVISLKDLIFAAGDAIIGDLMDVNYQFCQTNDDQESVTKQLQKYDLLSLPVVDKENRLVGIITVDDAMDVIQEEAEEDFEKMAAMTPSDKPYLDTSVFSLYKHRIIWLLILMFSGMLTGAILEGFEEVISTIPLLVAFLPMINDTGGNCGSQAATMCIRGLTTGELTPKNWFQIWWKEFRVALLVAVSLATFNFLRIIIFNHNDPQYLRLAFVICVSLMATVVLAKSIGALLPLIAKKLHLDPAVCAAPMITTVVDCCAILIYFGLASTLLGL